MRPFNRRSEKGSDHPALNVDHTSDQRRRRRVPVREKMYKNRALSGHGHLLPSRHGLWQATAAGSRATVAGCRNAVKFHSASAPTLGSNWAISRQSAGRASFAEKLPKDSRGLNERTLRHGHFFESPDDLQPHSSSPHPSYQQAWIAQRNAARHRHSTAALSRQCLGVVVDEIEAIKDRFHADRKGGAQAASHLPED